MPAPSTDELLPDRDHYKELARQVPGGRPAARFPLARRQLLRLAVSFEYRARNLGRYELMARGGPVGTGLAKPAKVAKPV